MAESKLILGTVQFGLSYGINNVNGRPSQSEIDLILLKAYQSGIRCLDTAEAYGTAHEAIGSFHKRFPSCIFEIITKIPHEIDQNIIQRIEKYKKDLYVDHLKGLLFHSFKTYTESRKLLVDFDQAKHQVKSIGISIYTNDEFETAIADELISLIQLPFNLLDNFSVKGELMKIAKDNGKIIHTRSAFLQGLFFKHVDDELSIVKALKDQLIAINEIAKKNQLSIGDLALCYCTNQKHIDNVLVGVDNVDQLERNLKAANTIIRQDVIDAINHIQTNNLNLLNPAKWN